MIHFQSNRKARLASQANKAITPKRVILQRRVTIRRRAINKITKLTNNMSKKIIRFKRIRIHQIKNKGKIRNNRKRTISKSKSKTKTKIRDNKTRMRSRFKKNKIKNISRQANPSNQNKENMMMRMTSQMILMMTYGRSTMITMQNTMMLITTISMKIMDQM